MSFIYHSRHRLYSLYYIVFIEGFNVVLNEILRAIVFPNSQRKEAFSCLNHVDYFTFPSKFNSYQIKKLFCTLRLIYILYIAREIDHLLNFKCCTVMDYTLAITLSKNVYKMCIWRCKLLFYFNSPRTDQNDLIVLNVLSLKLKKTPQKQ